MSKLIDLTGQKFGLLTVIDKAGSSSNATYWRCLCECGNTVKVSGGNLKTGHTTSCGCKRKRSPSRTHGKSNTRLYYVWQNMINRCRNPKVADYHNYGGRGISVCKEWQESFQAFSDWAYANGYIPNAKRGEFTLDRKNPEENYCPDNCRWVNEKTQQNNKRNNHYITYHGETKTLSEWAEIKHIKVGTLHKRINVLRWSVEKSLNTP